MYSRHHRRVRVWLAIADVLIAAIAFYLAYQARLALPLEREFEIEPARQALLLGFTAAILLSVAFWFRSYDRMQSGGVISVLRESTRQVALTAVALVVFEYALRLDLSRPFLGLFAVFAWVLLNLFRFNAPRLFQLFRSHSSHVLIVGTGESATRLAQSLEESGGPGEREGLWLIGFIDDAGAAPDSIRGGLKRAYPVHRLAALPGLLESQVIDEVIFAVDPSRLSELEDIFLLCDEDGVRTRLAIDFFPHVNSQIYLDRLGASPMLTFSATPHDDLRLMVKRLTDVAISIAGLVLLAPFMALLATLVKLTSPGPAIFRQERCGLNGRRFVFYKFRSMCDNAEDMRAGLEAFNERQTVFKMKNDPRLTPIGRWLRRFSLDELPQLWNVLRGDMSIVGPRPPLPDEVRRYERWQRRRLRMRPGLTCLWAINGRDAIDFETWMKLDMQYIDNWSLALDWKIILQTIPRVLAGRGAS